jgi:hypothetical protein
MDPFNELPVDILLEIFESMDDFKDVFTFAQTSSALQRLCRDLSISPYLRHVKRLLPGDLLQDALAIMHFPSIRQLKDGDRRDLIDAHLRAWGDRTLRISYATSSLDLDHIFQLLRLHQRLWSFIRDYLNKATSCFLPCAYRHFPKWAHTSFASSVVLLRDRPPTGINSFDDCAIQETTRRHLLQAFLQYEMLCKVYLDIDDSQEAETSSDLQFFTGTTGKDASTSDNQSVNRDLFSSWDWDCLQGYRKHKLDIVGPWSLACVREYVTTLYDGMIADHIYWTPFKEEWEDGEEGEIYSLEEFQLNPGWRLLSGDCNERSFGGWGKLQPLEAIISALDEDWVHMVPNVLASAGFDLLSNILERGQEHFVRLLFRLCRSFCVRLPHRDLVSSRFPFPRPAAEDGDVWRASYAVRLFRQRAWVFLELDERRGPPIDEPLTYRCIAGHDASAPGNRASRRQKGQRYFRHEQWICHGQGSLIDHCLSADIAPFWK